MTVTMLWGERELVSEWHKLTSVIFHEAIEKSMT